MPIRKEYRVYYDCDEWRQVRQQILERAGNRCENCGKPNGHRIRVTRGGFWFDGSLWRDARGNPREQWLCRERTERVIRCVITIAHLNHQPWDNRPENLRALCQHCHLVYDTHFHYANRRRSEALRSGQAWIFPECVNVLPAREGGAA